MTRPDIPEDVFRRLAAEQPFYVIARRFGCDARTISALAERYQVTSAFVSKAATAEEQAQISALAAEGWPIKRIAEHLGRSQEFVSRRVHGRLPAPRLKSRGRPGRASWPVPDTAPATALRGRRYEDVDEDTLLREWPPGRLPLNGIALAAIGRARVRSLCGTGTDLCAGA